MTLFKGPIVVPTFRRQRRVGWKLARRSILIAFIVGTILTWANLSEALAAGKLSKSLLARIGCNFVVPFLVSFISAMLNAPQARQSDSSCNGTN
jgi:hypothetical protein